MKSEQFVGSKQYLPDLVDKIVEVDPKILTEDTSNPNTMTKRKLKRLSEVIKKYGFLVPLIIDTKGNIIDGHQRAEAAKLAGINPTALVIDTAEKDVDKKFLRQWLNKFRGQHDPEMDVSELEFLLEDESGSVLMEEYMDFKIGNLDEMRKILEDTGDDPLEEETTKDKKRRIVLFFTANDYPKYRDVFDKLMEKYDVVSEVDVIKKMIERYDPLTD